MMKLYWSPRSRSVTALWLLEETGQPYERVLTDISTGAQKTPEFLAINPMGKVPALTDGDIAIAEAAAICAYVAERFPDAKLAPPLGDARRAQYLQWLFFGPSCIEPALIQVFTKLEVPSSTAAWGNATQVFDVLDKALEKGPWILGDNFSAADIVIGSGLNLRSASSRWCRRGQPSIITSTAAGRGRRFNVRRKSRQDDSAFPLVREDATSSPFQTLLRRVVRPAVAHAFAAQRVRLRHRDDVVAGIDEMNLARDPAGQIRQ